MSEIEESASGGRTVNFCFFLKKEEGEERGGVSLFLAIFSSLLTRSKTERNKNSPSTSAFECLCNATEADGLSSSLLIVERTLTK